MVTVTVTIFRDVSLSSNLRERTSKVALSSRVDSYEIYVEEPVLVFCFN